MDGYRSDGPPINEPLATTAVTIEKRENRRALDHERTQNFRRKQRSEAPVSYFITRFKNCGNVFVENFSSGSRSTNRRVHDEQENLSHFLPVRRRRSLNDVYAGVSRGRLRDNQRRHSVLDITENLAKSNLRGSREYGLEAIRSGDVACSTPSCRIIEDSRPSLIDGLPRQDSLRSVLNEASSTLSRRQEDKRDEFCCSDGNCENFKGSDMLVDFDDVSNCDDTEETTNAFDEEKGTKSKAVHTNDSHFRGCLVDSSRIKGSHSKSLHIESSHCESLHIESSHTKSPHTRSSHIESDAVVKVIDKHEERPQCHDLDTMMHLSKSNCRLRPHGLEDLSRNWQSITIQNEETPEKRKSEVEVEFNKIVPDMAESHANDLVGFRERQEERRNKFVLRKKTTEMGHGFHEDVRQTPVIVRSNHHFRRLLFKSDSFNRSQNRECINHSQKQNEDDITNYRHTRKSSRREGKASAGNAFEETNKKVAVATRRGSEVQVEFNTTTWKTDDAQQRKNIAPPRAVKCRSVSLHQPSKVTVAPRRRFSTDAM